MARSLNKTTLIGNVGNDPKSFTYRRAGEDESRTGINLTIATDEYKRGPNGESETVTEWHRVTVYNDSHVKYIENYVRKGSRLYIEGRLQTRKYDANDGKGERTVTEIICGRNHEMIDMSNRNNSGQDNNPSKSVASNSTADQPSNNQNQPSGRTSLLNAPKPPASGAQAPGVESIPSQAKNGNGWDAPPANTGRSSSKKSDPWDDAIPDNDLDDEIPF